MNDTITLSSEEIIGNLHTQVSIDESLSVIDLVQNLLDIELSWDARRALSYLKHTGRYYVVNITPTTRVPISTANGVFVISLDGYGKEVYYTRNATGEDTVIEPLAAFKPYQPSGRVVIIENFKGMGPSAITVLEQKPKRVNIHDWLDANPTHKTDITMLLEYIKEDIELKDVSDKMYIANRAKREQQKIDHQLGKGWLIDVKLFDTDDVGKVAVVTTTTRNK